MIFTKIPPPKTTSVNFGFGFNEEIGVKVKGDVFGVVESVKAASDLYMPVSGEITEINESLSDSPELINDDPYEKGWVIRVKISEDDLSSLLSPEEYLKTIGTSS